MIAIRSTRLVAVPSARGIGRAVGDLTASLDPFAARQCVVIVPTRAAAEHLRRSLEARRLTGAAAFVLPHLLTRDEWLAWLVAQVPGLPAPLSPHERVVLLGAAARAAHREVAPAPFVLRPGIIDDLLAFYDTIRRQLKTIDDFDRLARGRFEHDEEVDRGAARLLAQAAFMAAAFRGYERRVASLGRGDEHGLRSRLLSVPQTPLRHVIVTVGDRMSDASGLWSADFDLLARLGGLATIDIVATRHLLDAGLRLRLRDHLPGILETDDPGAGEAGDRPTLIAPSSDGARLFFQHRDREAELHWVAREVRRASRREPDRPLARTAVVFKRPLPYAYLAGRVFPDAGVPHEMFDALPLASEPFAAAVDLVLENAMAGFTRRPLVALLRSPHFRFEVDGRRVGLAAVAQLDLALAHARYHGGADELSRLTARWGAEASGPPDGAHDAHDGHGPHDARHRRARLLARAGAAAAAVADELAGLVREGPPSEHLDVLLSFLHAHQRVPAADEAVRRRHLRARAAVLASAVGLRDAHRAFDDEPCAPAETAAGLRRWIERQTFAPRRGAGGVVVTDAQAARFGDFDTVFLVGLTAGEWPEPPDRNIFFPASVLRDLAWPDDGEARAAQRGAFRDQLELARTRVFVSTFTLEDETIVEPSPFLEQLPESGLAVEQSPALPPTRMTLEDALTQDPVRSDVVPRDTAAWLAIRRHRTPAADGRFHGQAGPAAPASYKVSALDRFLKCPFVYFASEILRLEEEPEDEEGLSPRARGRLVHGVLEAFYARWRPPETGALDVEDARRLFVLVAEEHLASLTEADAVIERARLLGSAAGPGVASIVLGLEAESPTKVVERHLEFSLRGDAVVRGPDGPRTVSLRAVADRIDVLPGSSFRVIDYKLTTAPDRKNAVQLPAYAAAAKARLGERDGRAWAPADLAYVVFGPAPHYVPLAEPGKLDGVLAVGEARLVTVVDRIERGDFPPQPAKKRECATCPYGGVCRKDYVRGD